MTSEASVEKYNPTPIEIERRHRIRLSVAAYTYEYHSDSIMTDAEFDALSLKINKETKTGNDLLDSFFLEHFDSCTGMWIRNHPEKGKLEWLYKNVYRPGKWLSPRKKTKKVPAKKAVDKDPESIYTWHKVIGE